MLLASVSVWQETQPWLDLATSASVRPSLACGALT